MRRSPPTDLKLTAQAFWQARRSTATHLDDVLGATVNLPLRYWRENMFFSGAPDDRVHALTTGRFPFRLVKHKTHPVFALEVLPDAVGCRVCPCTSSRPRRTAGSRSIRCGCTLQHTDWQMDRESFLVEEIVFNIPSDLAFRLRFRGQVPPACIKTNGEPSRRGEP